MEVVSFDIKTDLPKIRIIPLGDTHNGTVCCDEDKLETVIKKILSIQDAAPFVLGMGDFCEFINLNDRRFDPASFPDDMPANALDDLANYQFNRLYDKFLSRLQGLWLGSLEGNHEDKIRLRYYLDIIEDKFCKATGAQRLGITCLLRLDIKSPFYTGSVVTYAEHGTGAAATTGAALNKIDKKRSWVDADIYCMAHVHRSGGSTEVRLDMRKTGLPHLVEHKQILCVTGSFLRTYKKGARSYGEGKYPPISLGCRQIEIDLENKNITEGVFVN